MHNAPDQRELGVQDTPPRTLHAPLRIGFIGRLDPTKGIEPLLHAFAGAALPDAEFWIAAPADRSMWSRLLHAMPIRAYGF